MKDKRIRLTLQDCQVIAEALHIYDSLPQCQPRTDDETQRFNERIMKAVYDEAGERKFSWSQITDIHRRFHALAGNEGYYLRGSRK